MLFTGGGKLQINGSKVDRGEGVQASNPIEKMDRHRFQHRSVFSGKDSLTERLFAPVTFFYKKSRVSKRKRSGPTQDGKGKNVSKSNTWNTV